MPIEFEIKENIQIITINRPEVYNGLSKENKLQLADIINKASEDSRIRSIILTGAGKAFCTGQDLNDRNVGGGTDLGTTLETEWNPLIESIRKSSKPVIAAVNGVAAGAGVSIALNCDLVYCKPQTKFVGGFGKLALCLDAGSTYLLSRSIGPKKTFEFYISNSPLFAEELKNVGLINDLSEDPMEKALQAAKMISLCGPNALAIVKKNLQESQESTFQHNLKNEVIGQRMLGNHPNYQEGLKAFFEKRPPSFE
ncbi:MAG: enoyl-CoA hydratase-related protein [Bacteriovoracaceae bacterium]